MNFREQLWVCLQRYLQFDDPESKWERLLQLAIKHSPHQRVKIRQALRAPLSEQQGYFRETFGGAYDSDSLVASTIFNTILALQDVRMFAPVAFETWFASVPRPTDAQEFAAPAKSTASWHANFLKQINDLASKENLSTPQREWLLHSARAVPDWLVLLDDNGPWSDDKSRRFVIEFLSKSGIATFDGGNLAKETVDLGALSVSFEAMLKEKRADLALPAQFLPRLLVLVEGATETILMPHFARLAGKDMNALGVMILGTGGANQTSRKYLLLRELTNIPIYSVLDADAVEQIEIISDMLREQDRLHVWSMGDIEDTFAPSVVMTQVNHHLGAKGAEPLLIAELPNGQRRTLSLDKAYRKRDLGGFDKIGFARSVVERLTKSDDLPPEAAVVIKEICELATA